MDKKVLNIKIIKESENGSVTIVKECSEWCYNCQRIKPCEKLWSI